MDDDIQDPAHQVIDQTARAALMAATVAAEQVARHWRTQTENQAQAANADAERWTHRYNTQRRLAGIEVNAADNRWAADADLPQVARVWETARAWSELEPAEFGPHADRIRHLVQDRYGVDLAVSAGADPASAPEVAQQQRPEFFPAAETVQVDTGAATSITSGEVEDVTSDRAGDDTIVAPGTADASSSNGTTADLGTTARHDSETHRDELAQRALDAGNDNQAVHARVTASNAQAARTDQATSSAQRRNQGPPQHAQRTRHNDRSR